MDGQEAEMDSPRFTKEQKIGVILLLVFAVMSLALGALQIRNRLYAPFALGNSVPGDIKNQVNSVDALKYRDTDNDGLNDFDELYVYHTSVYLADTDSDGLTDQTEVARGSNPTCAAGADCTSPIVSGQSVSTSTGEFAPFDDGSSASYDLAQNLSVQASAIFADPTQVRALLISSGVKKEIVDKLSDQDLLTMVTQALNATSTSQTTNPTR